MAVKLELYRIFQTVAETGSISGAAEKLYLTQSALSQAIKQLESQLQVRLFSRTSRGVRLTTEGQLLYDYVRQAMGLLQSGEEKLALSRSLLLGQLSIGANDTITRTYLLPRLEAFHKAYPAIRLKILNGTSQMVLDMLSEGQVDVAFASQPARPQNFSIHPCFAMHTIFVASAQYPCSFEKTYSLPEIAALPLILLDKRASSRNYVEQLFLTHGISLQPEIELASREQIRAWQDERLVKTVHHVYEHVPYYRNLMKEKGVTPEDIHSVDDLYKLPFLTKNDLREAYPYGLLAVPLEDAVRIQSTSGTTGRRVVAFYTQHDLDLWEDLSLIHIFPARDRLRPAGWSLGGTGPRQGR